MQNSTLFHLVMRLSELITNRINIDSDNNHKNANDDKDYHQPFFKPLTECNGIDITLHKLCCIVFMMMVVVLI